jgi:hypothetical protein
MAFAPARPVVAPAEPLGAGPLDAGAGADDEVPAAGADEVAVDFLLELHADRTSPRIATTTPTST